MRVLVGYGYSTCPGNSILFLEMINHCSTTAYQLTPRVLFHAPCAMLHFSTIGSRYMARIAMHHFVATNNMSAHQGRGPNYIKTEQYRSRPFDELTDKNAVSSCSLKTVYLLLYAVDDDGRTVYCYF